jgi:hypothetical protein
VSRVPRFLLILLILLFAPCAPEAALAMNVAAHGGDVCCTGSEPPLPSVDAPLPCHDPATSPPLSCAAERPDSPMSAAIVHDCGDDCRQCRHHHGSAPSVLLVESLAGCDAVPVPFEAPFHRADDFPETRLERLERPPSLAT